MNRSYAQEAKSIMRKYQYRLGGDLSKRDELAEEAMNAELELLKQRQEKDRAKIFGKMSNKMYDGGTITSNRWLTVDPVTGYVYDKNKINTPDMEPMNFYNGIAPFPYQPPIVTPTSGVDIAYPVKATKQLDTPSYTTPIRTPGYATPTSSKKTPVVKKSTSGNVIPIVPSVRDSVPQRIGGRAVPTAPGLAYQNPYNKDENAQLTNYIRYNNEPVGSDTIVDERAPYRTPVSPLGMLPGVVDFFAQRNYAKQLGKLRYTPEMISPERINLAQERNIIDARRRSRSNLMKGLAYNISPSQRYSRALSGVLASDVAAGEEMAKSYMNEATTNAEYAQRAKMMNAESSNRANLFNTQLRQQALQAKAGSWGSLSNAFANYMADKARTRQMDNLTAMSFDNYMLAEPRSYKNKSAARKYIDRFLGTTPSTVVLTNTDELRGK